MMSSRGAKFIVMITSNIFGSHELTSGMEYAACAVSIYGSPRRCGGQGDILSGR